jgi:hypothetical protein
LEHSRSGKVFCSKTCQTLWRNSIYSGEKHARWNNGISIYRKILLKNGKQPICQNCKIKDTRLLNAHHVDHDRNNNDLNNLVWLCLNCHFLVHHDKIVDRNIRSKDISY